MIVKKPRYESLAERCRFILNELDVGDAWIVPNSQQTPSLRTTLQRASKQTGIEITTKREPEGLYIWRKE